MDSLIRLHGSGLDLGLILDVHGVLIILENLLFGKLDDHFVEHEFAAVGFGWFHVAFELKGVGLLVLDRILVKAATGFEQVPIKQVVVQVDPFAFSQVFDETPELVVVRLLLVFQVRHNVHELLDLRGALLESLGCVKLQFLVPYNSALVGVRVHVIFPGQAALQHLIH